MVDVARKAAYDALMRIEKDGAFSNLAMAKLHKLDALDASFATALCMGVLEKRRALDYLIMRHAQKTPDHELLGLLRLGTFQIFYMDRLRRKMNLMWSRKSGCCVIEFYTVIIPTCNVVRNVCWHFFMQSMEIRKKR